MDKAGACLEHTLILDGVEKVCLGSSFAEHRETVKERTCSLNPVEEFMFQLEVVYL